MAVVRTIVRDLWARARSEPSTPAFRNSGVWRYSLSVGPFAATPAPAPGDPKEAELVIFCASVRRGARQTTTADWRRLGEMTALLGCPREEAERVAQGTVKDAPDVVHRHLWLLVDGIARAAPAAVLESADGAPRITSGGPDVISPGAPATPHKCAQCGKPVTRELTPIVAMLASMGGILCAKCAGPDLDPEAGEAAFSELFEALAEGAGGDDSE